MYQRHLLYSLACLLPNGSESLAATLRVYPDIAIEQRAGPHSVVDVERTRYFRTYHIPGMYAPKIADELKKLRVSPARGTGPYLRDNGGDTQRVGWSPDMQVQFDRYSSFYRKAKARYPNAKHAMAGGNYPTAVESTNTEQAAVDATMEVRHAKGVQTENFGYSIDLIDSWLQAIRDGGGSLPSWFSPVNEPDAGWTNTPVPVLDHANFAREMALTLKDRHPDVKISGPSTAWSHPRADWGRWEQSGWERSFIETAGDAVGAYDFHLYSKEYWAYSEESPSFNTKHKLTSPNLYEGLKNGNPLIWDFGRAESYFDLIYAHHQATWQMPSLPVIITEFGRQGITPQKGPWASDYLYYLYSTTVTRLWMIFMDRPEIELTVPFILPISDLGHAPQRGQSLYTRPNYPEDDSLVATPLLNFYRFFRDFDGLRVVAKWEDMSEGERHGLFAIATRKGDELLVLLHNARSEPLELSLDTGIDEARIARMRWEGEEPSVYTETSAGKWRIDIETAEVVDPANLILAPEETSIVKFKLLTSEPAEKIVSERYYSNQTLVDLYKHNAVLSIDLPVSHAESARLVPSVSAPIGFSLGTILSVTVNGYTDSIDLGFTEGVKALLLPVHFDFPADILKPGENRFEFSLETSGSKWNAKLATLRIELSKKNDRN